MKDEYISFETGTLAKKLGFDWDCQFMFSEDGKELVGTKVDMYGNPNAYDRVSAPTQTTLSRWIREKHLVDVSSFSNASAFLWQLDKSHHGGSTSGGTYISYCHFEGPNLGGGWDTYEAALEAGLIAALKYIEENEKAVHS